MKFICSSGSLYHAIQSVSLDNRVSWIAHKEGWITFRFQSGRVSHLPVECRDAKVEISIDQDNRRWDWVKDACKRLPDQPITVTVTEKNVKIELDF